MFMNICSCDKFHKIEKMLDKSGETAYSKMNQIRGE